MKHITNLSDIKSIPVHFISTTNPKFQYIAGKQGTISYSYTVILFSSITYNMHTSYIKKLEIKNNVFIFTTRNSIYKFKATENYADTIIEIDNTELEKKLQAVGA